MSDFTNLSDCMAQAASVSRKKTTSALERRRSTVQTNSWDRYRILFPHSILEQFSTEFGQCETADKAGDNCMIPDKRLLEISRRVWPATAVFANMQHVEQVLHQQALYNQYQKGEPITFEEFLRFFQNFFELTKELHPNWGLTAAPTQARVTIPKTRPSGKKNKKQKNSKNKSKTEKRKRKNSKKQQRKTT
eukprot:GEMP01105465.1.p1 GENE.GEMP01105465.1~~GEMP01105465.1.p1  ORF type:complete len:191 (+),score=35.81 GEMP01105465.1:34-606(+)